MNSEVTVLDTIVGTSNLNRYLNTGYLRTVSRPTPGTAPTQHDFVVPFKVLVPENGSCWYYPSAWFRSDHWPQLLVKRSPHYLLELSDIHML